MEYFEEDLKKVHKVEHCKIFHKFMKIKYSYYGINWSLGTCVQGPSE